MDVEKLRKRVAKEFSPSVTDDCLFNIQNLGTLTQSLHHLLTSPPNKWTERLYRALGITLTHIYLCLISLDSVRTASPSGHYRPTEEEMQAYESVSLDSPEMRQMVTPILKFTLPLEPIHLYDTKRISEIPPHLMEFDPAFMEEYMSMDSRGYRLHLIYAQTEEFRLAWESEDADAIWLRLLALVYAFHDSQGPDMLEIIRLVHLYTYYDWETIFS